MYVCIVLVIIWAKIDLSGGWILVFYICDLIYVQLQHSYDELNIKVVAWNPLMNILTSEECVSVS